MRLHRIAGDFLQYLLPACRGEAGEPAHASVQRAKPLGNLVDNPLGLTPEGAAVVDARFVHRLMISRFRSRAKAGIRTRKPHEQQPGTARSHDPAVPQDSHSAARQAPSRHLCETKSH
ncbi:hypothetical protein B7P34_28155 [Streptosporangium nondiastaticum]|uniref:Uncharacterized protein n=1 Tax=Streptosporangium nondiastaticum TaxID=35764 RepID=A0A9X7JKQ8_9ACTN|nr:hypothetical protein B7P34_28155 [Streptosporangium nondiastaticum]